ncbi:MAG: enoyl-CoA hydratase/isomerase family protein [Coxiellaceae bacterium]|nr:enoyl-CoA hydratase/isomerase family protein [Coxiellaceae bacterium]
MPDILFEVIEKNPGNKLGKIILNRPKALNALNGDMFTALEQQLIAWENDASIKAVLIRSNNEKAFCAGGDIRAVYEGNAKADYFRREYNVNRQIYHYSKPYIAFMNGITMGGGVGISIPGRYRITSTDLRLAMPETLIGFFPDVGATYYLSRLPNHVGTYLALIGNAIHAQDALQLQFVDAVIPREQFDAVERAIVDAVDSDIASIIQQFHTAQNGKTLCVNSIAKCFQFETVEAILAALENEQTEWAVAVLSQLKMRSPTSLKVTMRQLQLAKQKSFDEVIEMDYHIAKTMLEQHDFHEGIRAAIIDKDKNPTWCPGTLSDVTEERVQRYFER